MALQKYLANYAHSDVKHLSDPYFLQQLSDTLTHAVVIPCFDEQPEFVYRFISGHLAKNNLLILVINEPETLFHPCEKNRLLTQALCETMVVSAKFENLTLLSKESTEKHAHVLLVNHYSESLRLPEKKGVGLARKIGCDLAVQLFNMGKIKSPWIYSTDADAFLPDNYFDQNVSPSASAKVFNFHHIQCDTQVSQATQLYEQSIKYYQQGLLWAKSPYAFYTLGSTLAVHAEYYCQVRGFPTRSAGEDFYLLNKLAKVGHIEFAHHINIEIEARTSERVPFGTGPAVKKIMEGLDQEKEYCYYNPLIFVTLKTLLSAVTELANNTDYFAQLPPTIQATLTSLGFHKFETHAKKQCKNEKQFVKSFHDWFDAFMTLKFVHTLQQNEYPDLPLDQCLKQASQLFKQL